jgi:Icc-related predicted phosphoesterase
MRLLIVADIHARASWWGWLRRQAGRFDALLIAGDLITIPKYIGQEKKIAADCAFAEATCREIACQTPVFVCQGNHDEVADWPWMAAQIGQRTMGRLLIDCLPSAFEEGWEARLIERRAQASRDGLLWLALDHYPPFNSRTAGDGDTFGLSHSTADFGPDIVVSGHVHAAPFSSRGSWHDVLDGRTLCLNPGCLWKAEVPCHIILDLGTHSATLVTPDGMDTIPLPIFLAHPGGSTSI